MAIREDLERLDAGCWQNDYVKIKPLATEADLIYAGYDCQLTDEQKDLVSPVWFSIGRAYLLKEDHYPCIIYNEKDEKIGFINLFKWLGAGDAYTWSYFIDLKHQGRGYGKQAAILAINILTAANPTKAIKLATEVQNTKAQRLYTDLGFQKLSETDGDDLVFGL